MQRRFILYLDLIAFAVVGAAAGECLCVREIRASLWQDREALGAVVGSLAALLLTWHLLTSPELKGLLRPSQWLVRAVFIAAGAAIGVRSCRFLWDWDRGPEGHLHFVSLFLMVGLLLTYGIVRLQRALAVCLTEKPSEDGGSIPSFLVGCLFPIAALVVLRTGFEVSSYTVAFLASIGAVLGSWVGHRICTWPDESGHPQEPLKGFERAASLVICAGLILVTRHALMALPGQGLRRVFLSVIIASGCAIFGAVVGVGLTQRAGTGKEGSLGLASWQIFAFPRALLLLLGVGAGAVVGEFVYRELLRITPGFRPYHASVGAILGGLAGLFLYLRKAPGGTGSGRALDEGVALAYSFVKVAVPLGLLIFAAALAYHSGFTSGYPIYIGLVFGPLVGGTLGMLWRARRLYERLRAQDWLVLAWGWGVGGLFAIGQDEVLSKVLHLVQVVPTVLLVTPGFLVLLAVKELVGKEEGE